MHKEELKEVVGQLRKKGVRITPQRVAMLEFLASVHTHPTAEEIFKALTKEDPQVSVATVYNNLNLFIKEGVVKELTYGDSASRYDFDLGQHYHAVCDVCGKVVDLYYPVLEDVEKAAEQLTGFKVRGHRMEVYGVCPECQKKKK